MLSHSKKRVIIFLVSFLIISSALYAQKHEIAAFFSPHLARLSEQSKIEDKAGLKSNLENPKEQTPVAVEVEPPEAATQKITQTSKKSGKTSQQKTSNVDHTALTSVNIIFEINRHRSENGLSKVTQKSLLDQAALNKSKDMADKNYFEHVNPAGKTDFQFIDDVGYQYQAAGSNIAMGGFKSAPELVDAWMNSPGHRENILAKFGVNIGIGIYKDYFTMFIAS